MTNQNRSSSLFISRYTCSNSITKHFWRLFFKGYRTIIAQCSENSKLPPVLVLGTLKMVFDKRKRAAQVHCRKPTLRYPSFSGFQIILSEESTGNTTKRRLLVNPHRPEIQTEFCWFSRGKWPDFGARTRFLRIPSWPLCSQLFSRSNNFLRERDGRVAVPRGHPLEDSMKAMALATQCVAMMGGYRADLDCSLVVEAALAQPSWLPALASITRSLYSSIYTGTVLC